ncbi:MAG TPA: DNA alkylation repair protein [Sulfurimonas sp. UBA12504]|nr:MAG TPA: DNA alkylation repair protein [Sulfurimonas sp. UBA12504]
MAEPLKNIYTYDFIVNVAEHIRLHYAAFDVQNFIKSIFCDTWKKMELKARMRNIALQLHQSIPLDYKTQLAILKSTSKDFFSFEAMFFQDFVEVFGLDDFEASMEALAVFTMDSSSEFAVRQFIIKYEEQTLAVMKVWAKSEDEHLRRLASEGCRPRLPWAVALPRFKQDPTKVLEIIELLKNDPSLYVRKSVANSLNDISKDHPHIVKEFVKNNRSISKELDWICKHAARTLLKKGNNDILKLFDLQTLPMVSIENFIYDKSVHIGDDFYFSFLLSTHELIKNIRVEYIIEYFKANKRHNKKVFMLAQGGIDTLQKNFLKKQSFKDMSTRKHYAGEHFLSIVVNGEEKIRARFMVHNEERV